MYSRITASNEWDSKTLKLQLTSVLSVTCYVPVLGPELWLQWKSEHCIQGCSGAIITHEHTWVRTTFSKFHALRHCQFCTNRGANDFYGLHLKIKHSMRPNLMHPIHTWCISVWWLEPIRIVVAIALEHVSTTLRMKNFSMYLHHILLS